VSSLAYRTVPELGRMIRCGEVSPVQLAEEALDRLETVGRSLNAVVTLAPDLALEQARQAEEELAHGVDRGPLHGIPYGAKDLFATVGIPTSWGMAPHQRRVIDEDAAVIERLREAGAVLVAKLAMVEGAGGFGYEQPNATFTGPGRSAWKSEAWAGGSSSGSGSAVGAGCVPFALGTETWGSILIPSAFNGLTGFRPTHGMVSRRGAMALSWTLDKIGPMCRTAQDCGIVLAAIAGFDSADPSTRREWFEPPRPAHTRLRIAVLRGAAERAQPEVGAAFGASLDILRQMGDLEEVDLPGFPWEDAAGLIISVEGAAAFEDFLRSGEGERLTAPEDRMGLWEGLVVPAVDYLRALRVRRKGMQAMDDLLSRFDVIVAPAVGFVAPLIEDRFDTWFDADWGPSLGAAGNLCGLPSIGVPNGVGERGLPIALEFMGRAFGDGQVVAAAMRYQELTQWHERHPAR
jgi:aspartyl-tRNA(Asn)/glutamyl-tRNA(Gln) amidotransferase subunit A